MKEPQYKVISSYPSTENGEFYMADCGQDHNDNKRYYIASDKAEPYAKDFSNLVVELLNKFSSMCQVRDQKISELKAELVEQERHADQLAAEKDKWYNLCKEKLDA